MNKRKVVNISGIPLTNSETSLLSKGLNFSPAPNEIKKQIIYKDIDEFKRNLSLKVLFKKTENNEKNEKEKDNKNCKYEKTYKSSTLDKIIRQQNKKPFQPPHENSIQAYADALKDDVKNTKRTYPKANLTDQEYTALQRLAKRTDIVIKRADKGGATVVCSSDWYIKEAI